MGITSLLYNWFFKRLPLLFSVPLVIVLVAYLAFGFPLLARYGITELGKWVTKQTRIDLPPPFGDIVWAICTIGLLLFGFVLAYASAALIYSWIRRDPMPSLIVHDPVPNEPPDNVVGRNPFQNYERIGIILAGGGAKGAYQAGAMQAIYQFLEKHNAHDKVKMIAGTSIGSWNAMFWLAGLMKAPNGGKALLQQWWEQVSVGAVIQPSIYLPFRQNFFLSSKPWQQVFDKMFVDNAAARARLEHHLSEPDANDALHFYFTRSNVGRAILEFTTNHRLGHVGVNMPTRNRPRPAVVPNTWNKAQNVADLKNAVFASMDLPPLFPYSSERYSHYEDGGVIDNLPIRFGTEVENCDLLFILPLNASFAQEPNLNSITSRLFRVMNVRQGVMERNSFKLIYLYNELAALRERLEAADGQLAGNGELAATDPASRALSRKHKPLHVLAICPGPPLRIDTAEFWKTNEAGRAFATMHDATTIELEKFASQAEERDWVGIAIVNPLGETSYLEDF